MNEQINYFLQKYDITLNEQQRNAVCETDGAVLLLAVPGSGKTTVLVSRLGYMIYEKGIAPESILTMTYTVAAAADMKRRFVSFFGEEYADRLQFRTINGVCQSILNRYTKYYSSREPFRLLSDEKEQTAFLLSVCREYLAEYPTESDLKDIKTKITYAKNSMLTEDEAQELDTDELPFLKIYRAYNAALREKHRMDFDDQLKYALTVLRTVPQVLAAFTGQFRYFCVDEAQDTSKIQHEIIRLLASASGNLFMVGDEDQSIYGFRAAYPQGLTDFSVTYPNAKILFLEENFRSVPAIVDRANRFITQNKNRQPKHMQAARTAGGFVKEVKLAAPKAQYAYLMKVAKEGTEQTAVLYKDNETAIPLIAMLHAEGVEFSLRGGDFVFFSSRTVQDIKNIMLFSLDNERTDLFLRFYPKLGLFIKKDIVLSAADEAKKAGTDILAALMNADLTEFMRGKVRALITNFAVLRRESAPKALFRIKYTMEYAEYMSSRPAEQRKFTILELLAKEEKNIADFLDKLDYLNDLIKNKQNTPGAKFILSTIHSSKGLEYDNVFLADVYDGLLPESYPGSKADDGEKERFEEERRLFYVAVTRAKNRLTVFTYADRSCGFSEAFFAGKGKPLKRSPTDKLTPIRAPWTPRRGEYVYHKIYGKGQITAAAEDKSTVTVAFAGGERKLLTDVLLSNGILFYCGKHF